MAAGNGASITFWGTLDGSSALTLTTGTNSGSSPFNAVSFKQQIGAPAAEPAITIVSAYNVIFSAGIRAVSLTQVTGLGTTTLTGAVDTSGVNSNGNGVELVTGTVAVNDNLTSHNNPISLQASGHLTVSATSGTVVDSGTSPIGLTADSDNNGSGILTLSDNVTVKSGNTTAAAITLRAADVTIGSLAAVTAAGSGGGLVIRSSAATRPMSLGGGTAVTGINLSDAELARITTAANGRIAFGDSAQTGDILLVTATPATTAGAATVVVQSTGGAGQIVLNDGGTGSALNGNGGAVSLTAGTGGIQAATAPNVLAEIANATAVTLNSGGGIGTTQSLQLGATSLTTNSSAAGGSQSFSALSPVTLTSLDAGSGTIQFGAGTFQYGAGNVVADGSSVNVAGAAILNVGTFSDTLAGVTLTNGAISGAGGVLTSTHDVQVQSGSVSAVLAGSVGLTKTTAGTVTLSGSCTYTGITAVAAGTLALANTTTNNNLGASAAIDVQTGATLDVTGLDNGGVLDTLILSGGQTLQGRGDGHRQAAGRRELDHRAR